MPKLGSSKLMKLHNRSESTNEFNRQYKAEGRQTTDCNTVPK